MADSKNKLTPKSTDTDLSRRDFLKIVSAAAAGTVLTACAPRAIPLPETTPIPPTPTASQSDIDFSGTSYCGINCKENCPERAYPQTCDGCKAPVGNEKCGSYCCNCPVRKCAQESGVLTCAHCEDFPTCEQETWASYPGLRRRVEQIRAEIQK